MPEKDKALLSTVREIMMEFARETGLSPARKFPRRYLWTDAFAVCNFLGLYRQTEEMTCRDLAIRLIDQVHETLGRHHPDDPRSGWISGLEEQEGREHPTRGGLRIGKALLERGPRDPFDEGLEWDRDGQYYHYLTKWMHALECAGRITEDLRYLTWATELAKTAQAGFVYAPFPGGPKRMFWKMSIDLTRPLVPSMGHHDPLDGLITCLELQASSGKGPENFNRLDLGAEISALAEICLGKNWATDDPLGIGGLLFDAGRLAQLIVNGHPEQTALLEDLLESALLGLKSFERGKALKLPAAHRLAFRELGLSIGLRAVEMVRALLEQQAGALRKTEAFFPLLTALNGYVPTGEIIESFWLEPENREADSWTGHEDINKVMLATSLAPAGFLTLT